MFDFLNKKNLYVTLLIFSFSLPFIVTTIFEKDAGISNAILIGETFFFALWLITLTFLAAHFFHEFFFLRAKTKKRLIQNFDELYNFLKKKAPEHQEEIIKKARDLWYKGQIFQESLTTKKGEYYKLKGALFHKKPFIEIENITQYKKDYNALKTDYELCKKELHYAQLLVENIPLPIWQYSEKGQLLYGNEYYKNLTGKQKETLISQKDIIENNFPKIEKIIQEGQREVWRFDKGKNHIYYGKNISREQALEQKLKESQKIQANLLDHLDISMAIFGPDTKIKYYNQTYLKLWGLSPKIFKERPRLGDIIDYLYSQKKLPEFGSHDHFKKERLNLFKNLINEHESILYLPDGRIFRTLVIPHIDGNLLFIHENISEFYNLKCKIHNLEQMNQTILDELKEAILIFGENGRIQYFNKALHHFYPFSEIKFKLNDHISTLRQAFEQEKIPQQIQETIHRYAISPPEDKLSVQLNEKIRLTSHYLPDGSILNRFSYLS